MGYMNLIGARSYFSVGESLMGVDDLVAKAVELGYDTIAIADTMTISGAIDFANAAKKKKVKAIIGVRLRIFDDPTYKPPNAAATRAGEPTLGNLVFYPKVYARTEEGLKRIMRLLTRAYDDDRFYKVGRLGLADLLAEFDPKDLVVTGGDSQSVQTHPKFRAIWAAIQAVSYDNSFLELVPVNTPHFDRCNAETTDEGVLSRTIVSRPAFYTTAGDAASVDVLGAITGGSKMSEPWTKTNGSRDLHLMSIKEIMQEAQSAIVRCKNHYWNDTAEAWRYAFNTSRQFVDMCAYEWKKMPISMPKMADNEFATLVAMCKEGFAKRFTTPVWGHQPTKVELDTVYMDRLKYELGVLARMGFSGYFLLVADLVTWAKGKGIVVGPGRGSVGGSLVAYLCGITEVDPIRFNLLFERFINPERLDLPDADLDFMSERRDEVIRYLIGKYGAENVAGITSYTAMQAAGALRDVARAFDVPMSGMAASKLIPKEHGQSVSLEEAAKAVPELEKIRVERPEVWGHAEKMEGVMRGYGRHAAGVIVAGEPVVNRAVIERRQDNRVVNWDKYVVEDMGLVKIDVLGLRTLDVFDLALRMIFKRHGRKMEITDLALDDPKTLEAFGRGDTVGVFQFESSGMRKLLKDMARFSPLTFDELSAATALYRPGPMDSGLMDDYVGIRQGVGGISYEHPNMKAALKSTYGVLVYQEQVMRLARDLAGFTLAGADHLRKAIGKKNKDKMAEQRDAFVAGCTTHSGMDAIRAGILFDKIEKFAGYAFNLSHSVEYSLISYAAMWIKVHYPLEFYAAAMSLVKEDEALAALVTDANKKGIAVMAPDINYSSGVFEVLDEKTLLVPFNRIKGISDNTTIAILKARETGRFTDVTDFLARVEKRRCNVRHQEHLEKVGAFATITPGSPAVDDPCRLRDQQDLMPGIIVEAARVNRQIEMSALDVKELAAVIGACRVCQNCDLKDGVHPIPRLGKKPKFVVVSASPFYTEERAGKLMEGEPLEPLKLAMQAAGLGLNDGYFTTLVKSPKKGKTLTNQQVAACAEWLEQELAIIKPPVIVALGSAAARYFMKDVKGGIEELSGKLLYDKDRDCNIFVSITPGMVAFDGGKQRYLDEVFAKVAQIVL